VSERVLLHYRLGERLGTGASGDVYLAEDLRLHRPVALKMLREDATRDDGAAGRLLREARVASALSHPNIAVVYEIGEVEHEGRLRGFIAMEHVRGRTLLERLKSGPLPPGEALAIARQVAEALLRISPEQRAILVLRDSRGLDYEQIAEVLATWTGIPVFKLTEEETARLLRMELELHKRVIGQEPAVKAVSQAIRRTRAGLKDPKRPGGSFIFAGPSGVGKTELSKTLADFLFGDENALIQLDMSEYMEKHTVSRLVGSPPGYVGYEEGGQLTERVRRKPFSVVLFDEVEKAHPDVFNTLLQILEDGRLTDSQGRVVDFKNTILIMTSNLGTRDISKGLNLGFSKAHDKFGDYERMKTKVVEELKQHFRPEFLNRIDDTIVFHQLSEDEIVQIVDLMLNRVDAQLRNKDMGLELTPAAKALLAKKGYDPVMGARPLRRTIQREIEDILSEKILFGDLKAGQIVVVDVTGEGEGAAFCFRGEVKPAVVPDTPPVETAGSPE